MNLMRSLLTIIGLTFTIWFSLPVVTGGIRNIGNITGMLFSAILALFGLVGPDRIRAVFSRGAVILFIVLYSCLALYALIMASVMIHGAHTTFRDADRESAQNPTVIILGCRTKSRMMNERIQAGFRCLQEHPESVCILSGGTGPDESESEADYMYSKLTGMGIDGARLRREDRSLNTFQNLKFSNALIRSENLNQHTIIVTHEFHQYRSCRIARRFRLIPCAGSVATPWWLLLTYASRESFAIIKEWISTPV